MHCRAIQAWMCRFQGRVAKNYQLATQEQTGIQPEAIHLNWNYPPEELEDSN
jgi:hypothetical protein